MPLPKSQLKQLIDERIRNKTQVGSISQEDIADICEEACDMMVIEQMDIFLIAGQSNAKGQSGASGGANSPDPAPNTIYQFHNDALAAVTNEVGFANTGSFWPSFGITWFNITRRKICFIPLAVNSTALLPPPVDDAGAGNWSPTGFHYPNSIVKTNAAIAAVLAAGYNPVFRGVLWSQGETDAIGINNAQATQTQYRDALLQLIANYRTNYGSTMPFYIFKTGQRVLDNDAGYASVRIAEEDVVLSAPHINKMVFRGAYDFVARGMMADVVHYAQTGYNEGGRTGAENILSGRNDIVQSFVVATTADLAKRSTYNTMLVIVKDVGIFSSLTTTDPADNSTTFASAEPGRLWQQVL